MDIEEFIKNYNTRDISCNQKKSFTSLHTFSGTTS